MTYLAAHNKGILVITAQICFKLRSFVSTCPTPSPRMEATGQNFTDLLLKMCACGTFIPALSVKMEFCCTRSTAAWQITPAELQKAESENSQQLFSLV